jgi:phage terminase large subunit GpA-like protein
MDCLSQTSRVTDIVIMCSSQIGKTDGIIVNALGYTMDHAPCPIMVMLPTLEMRDAWKVQKLNPLLTDTPVIRDLLGGQRSRDAANSKDMIDFPGGVLFLAGGNSPNSYAQRSVRIIILDDLDRFPIEVGDEGDPVALARGRTKSFPRAKRVFISTPTTQDESLINREYEASDMRRYHVPCPHCSELQPLEWGGPDVPHGIKFSKDLTHAWYVCRECGAEIYEHQKPQMLAEGRWIAQHPERGDKVRGYHINALYAPIGLGPSWLDLARGWTNALRNPAALKTFINTDLGEVWVEKGDQVDSTGLLARVEDYPEKLNEHILAKTVGADVQKDRIEVTLDGWGLGEENWTLDHVILPGDTAQPDVWGQLAELLTEWAPDAAAIDSGYNTSMVYAFVEKRRWAYAVKGMPGPGRPLVEDQKVRLQRLRKRKTKGVMVELVGDDQAKALIYARLKLTKPGPGYIHFPVDPAFDDEYFAQLTAEKLVTKIRGTRPVAEWVQTRPRNETLDCKKYSLAALRLSGINLEDRLAKRMAAKAAPISQPIQPPAHRPGGWSAKNW